MAWPITSSPYGGDQPPCWKPSRVSSSARPGACMTPSKVTWLSTTTLLISKILSGLDVEDCRRWWLVRRAAAILRSEADGHSRVEADLCLGPLSEELGSVSRQVHCAR